MDRILLAVDPAADERDTVVTWAADLVEAITAPLDDSIPGPRRTVAVVADLFDCLQIAACMYGRAEARTVETPERRPSPVTLYPFRPQDRPDLFAHWTAASECLQQLAESGAVEGIGDAGEMRDLPDAGPALLRALNSGSWEAVVALGESSRSFPLLTEWLGGRPTRLVRPRRYDEIGGRVEQLMRRVQLTDDEYWQERLLAVQSAVQLESMMLELRLDQE